MSGLPAGLTPITPPLPRGLKPIVPAQASSTLPPGLKPIRATPAPTVTPPPASTAAPTPLPKGSPEYGVPGNIPNPVHAGEHAYNTANHFMLEAQRQMAETANNAIQAATNVEQTPARGLGGLIQHGLTPEGFAAAFHDALTPGEGDSDTNAVVGKVLAGIHGGTARVLGDKTDNKIGAAARNFAELFVAQSIADPVSYFPVVGQLGRIAGASRLLDGMAQAARATGGAVAARPLARSAMGFARPLAKGLGQLNEAQRTFLRQRPELDSMLEPHAKAAHLGFEHRHIAEIERELNGSDRELLAAHEKELKEGGKAGRPLPVAIQQRLLQEAWRYGTPEMRQQALKLGYQPKLGGGISAPQEQEIRDAYHGPYLSHADPNTPIDTHNYSHRDSNLTGAARTMGDSHYGSPLTFEQFRKSVIGSLPKTATGGEDAKWAKAPEGLLDYDLRADYQYAGKVGSNLEDSPIFKKYGGQKIGRKSAFEHEREGNWKGPEADQYERTRARLNMGNRAVWERRAKNDTAAYLAAHGGWKPTAGNVDVSKLTSGPIRFDSPFRALGRLGTQAVQGTVLPHAINNVGVLTYLKSPLAVGRAIGYMAAGVSPEKVARIERMGALADYTGQQGTIWEKLPVSKQLLAANQKLLGKMETAYRAGLMDELDRTLGASHDGNNVTNLRLEMQKGHAIRDAVVDYRNVPLVIAAMEAAGAPFSAFLGGLTGAVTRAVIHHPDRVAAVQRGENDSQTQLGWTIPNPVNTYERLVFNTPETVVQRLGLLGALFAGHDEPRFNRIEDIGSSILQRAGGPWLSQVPAFFNEPYPDRSKPPFSFTPEEGAASMTLGAYPYHPPSAYKEKQLQRAESREDYDLFEEP